MSQFIFSLLLHIINITNFSDPIKLHCSMSVATLTLSVLLHISPNSHLLRQHLNRPFLVRLEHRRLRQHLQRSLPELILEIDPNSFLPHQQAHSRQVAVLRRKVQRRQTVVQRPLIHVNSPVQQNLYTPRVTMYHCLMQPAVLVPFPQFHVLVEQFDEGTAQLLVETELEGLDADASAVTQESCHVAQLAEAEAHVDRSDADVGGVVGVSTVLEEEFEDADVGREDGVMEWRPCRARRCPVR